MALSVFVYVRSCSALQLLMKYPSAGLEWSLYYGRRMAECTGGEGILLSRRLEVVS